MPKSEEVSGMSTEQLVELLKELRKPVKTEKEIREERDYEASRTAMMETLKQEAANKDAAKRNCSHMRSNGSTTCTWVGGDINKLYCQVCTDWIGPERPEMFNRLYQLAI